MCRFPCTGLTLRILEQVKIIKNMQIGLYASSNIVRNEHALLRYLIILSSFFSIFFYFRQKALHNSGSPQTHMQLRMTLNFKHSTI